MQRIIQLEHELLHITDQSDASTSAPTNEQWNSFASKLETLAHLESKSNRKVKDLLTAHEAEKKSFPPRSEGTY